MRDPTNIHAHDNFNVVLNQPIVKQHNGYSFVKSASLQYDLNLATARTSKLGSHVEVCKEGNMLERCRDLMNCNHVID